MANPISKKISVKASTAKPSGKPSPGDKTCGIEPEDVDETEKGEEAEILVVYNSSFAVFKYKRQVDLRVESIPVKHMGSLDKSISS